MEGLLNLKDGRDNDMIDTNLTDARARIRALEAQLAEALKALEQAEQQLDYGQINAAHQVIIHALEAQGGKQT